MSNQTPQSQLGRTPINVFNENHTGRASNPQTSTYRFTDQRLIQHFELAIANSPTLDALLANVTRVVSDQGDCLGLWVCQANEVGEFGSPHVLSQPEGEALWTVVQDHAGEMIERVARTRQICSSPLRSDTESSLVVAPISPDVEQQKPIQLILIGCFSSLKQSVLRQQWLVGLVAQTISRWHELRLLKVQETKNRSLTDTIGLMHALDQSNGIEEAAVVIVNQLRRLCQTDQVAIGICDRPKRSKLVAISDVEQIDLHSESIKITANACNQSVVRGNTIIFPNPDGEPCAELLAMEKFCKSNGFEACLNIPLKTQQGRVLGAILVGTNSKQISSEGFQDYLTRIVSLTAGHLDVVMRANQTVTSLAKRRWAKIGSSNVSKVLIGLLIVVIGIMCIPLPYRINCDSEIQPVMRRFIAAPHDGILEKTFVENGDLVEKNQLVALLDGRQKRIELSGLRAEFDGARKRRDSALAQGEIAKSQIARSEMKRHQARITILEQQLGHLEVRSPIAGIVVNGDLEKVEGAPLEMGQTLFEVAPLDDMLADVGIPESEIKYARPGMPVAIKLNAFPFKTWEGVIDHVQPRTEIIDDESVFIAQVKLPNVENQLRPGMNGSAKITSDKASLGWNLFHRPWESVRYWMIW